MILNDLTTEPTHTQAWAKELDKRLDNDEVGCLIEAHDNELTVHRRDKVVKMIWPFGAMSERIMDDRFNGIDSEEFYISHVANEIRRIVRDHPSPRQSVAAFLSELASVVKKQTIHK